MACEPVHSLDHPGQATESASSPTPLVDPTFFSARAYETGPHCLSSGVPESEAAPVVVEQGVPLRLLLAIALLLVSFILRQV